MFGVKRIWCLLEDSLVWLTVSRMFLRMCGVQPSLYIVSGKRNFLIDYGQFCICLRIVNFVPSSIRFSFLPPASKTTRFLNICTTRFPKAKSPYERMVTKSRIITNYEMLRQVHQIQSEEFS